MDNDAESSNNPISQGSGSNPQISVQISPTTGGEFALVVDPSITIDTFKKLVSKKLKVPRDRLCLLFRNKQLQEGNLELHGVTDGSKITLLPNVETGLIAQKPEIGIMQALESLNDTQVNDFLCGKAPLNLTMRLGDHMMLIQLQLSTVQSSRLPSSVVPVSPSRSQSPARSSSHCPCRPPSLTQASRNLQHTLRRLSADVLSGREDFDSSSSDPRRGSIYSGTFSGALNPALQDTRGRPRRDVATIVHILNDLLCSAPTADLRRVGRKMHEHTTATVPQTSHQSPTSSGSCLATPVQPSSSSSSPKKQCASKSCTGTVKKSNDATPSTSSCDEPAKNITQWNSDDANVGSDEQQITRTRDKLEQLRLVMGQRRERRKQRKQKIDPYALAIPVTADPPVNDSVSA